MPANQAVLLAGPATGAPDRHMADLLRFLGVPCTLFQSQNSLPAEPKLEANTGGHGLVIHADTLGRLLKPGEQRQRLRCFLDEFDSTLIYGLGPSALAEEDLRFLTGNLATGYSTVQRGEGFFVSDQHRALCGSLSGLQIEQRATDPAHGIQFAPDAQGVDTFIRVGAGAAFARLICGKSRLFLCNSHDALDLEQQLTSNFDAASIFVRLVPHVMYARDAFPERCWKPKRHKACLIIDDPLLRPRYGFLNLVELLQRLNESRLAANLAFIPWNCDRSRPAIADLVRRTDRFALCIHGCDHTRAEFGSTDHAWLDTLVQLALERMERHQKRTGIAHQQIMVFPQGVFSDQAMSVLKRRNFVAAVNTEVVPNHGSSSQCGVALGGLLDVALTSHDSFPLFSRRNCSAPIADFALDIFMGKPCLLVAHHDYFRSGFDRLKTLVEQLGQVAPELEWTTLENGLNESYLLRRVADNTVAVRMFANQMLLENHEAGPVRFEIMKLERDDSAIDHVLVNGAAIAFDWSGNHLRIHCTLMPGQKAKLRIAYKEPVKRGREVPSIRYRARSAARRYLSEIRDDYVQPLKHMLQGADR